MTDIASIILAAGKGTRMKSIRAKVNFSIAGKTMLQRVVQTALRADCKKLCVVVGYQKDAVITSLAGYGSDDIRLSFVEQFEQLGTGHAVLMAESEFKDYVGDIFILCGDVPLLSAQTLSKMHQKHRSSGALATVLTAFLDDAGKYGRIIRDDNGSISAIIEYKDATAEQRRIQEFNTGIYCFDSTALYQALSKISNDNEQQEYYLTDVIKILYQAGQVVEYVVLDNLLEASGVNSQEHLAELEDAYFNSIKKHWLNNGVVIHNPATVIIGEDVEIETDVEIGAHCILEGSCRIGYGTFIGHDCLIRNAVLGQGSVLDGRNMLINNALPAGRHLKFGENVIERGVIK